MDLVSNFVTGVLFIYQLLVMIFSTQTVQEYFVLVN